MKRIILLCIIALPVFAQTPRSGGEGRTHQISKIDFRSRIPSSILRSESALDENREYTDQDLADAVNRIKRLPFVYDARYTLTGTTLVIEAAAQHHFLYDVDIQGNLTGRPGFNRSFIDSAVGLRYFAGRGGVLEGAFGSVAGEHTDLGSFDVKYSQYGIAKHAFASVSLSRAIGGDFGNTDIEPTLTLGAALSPRQTVSLVAFHTGFHDTQTFAVLPRPLQTKIINNQVELHWRYDTTNDPFFARSGRSIEVVPSLSRFHNLFEGFSIRTIQSNDTRGTDSGIAVEARNYWPIHARWAAFGEVIGSNIHESGSQRFEDNPAHSISSTKRNAEAAARLTYNFFDASSFALEGRHRLEAGVRYVDTNFSRINGRPDRHFAEELAYVYRNRWGAFRFTLGKEND